MGYAKPREQAGDLAQEHAGFLAGLEEFHRLVCPEVRAAMVVRAGKGAAAFSCRVGTVGRVKAGVPGLFLSAVLGCNTATPSSKSANTKACGNVTTVNNHFGLASATNALSQAASGCSGGSCSEK